MANPHPHKQSRPTLNGLAASPGPRINNDLPVRMTHPDGRKGLLKQNSVLLPDGTREDPKEWIVEWPT